MKQHEVEGLIAEKVLGLDVHRNKKGEWSIGEADYYSENGYVALFNPVPGYLTNVDHCWQVVSRLASNGAQIRLSNKAQGNDYWWCYVSQITGNDTTIDATAQGSTVNEAVCLAALILVGINLTINGEEYEQA